MYYVIQDTISDLVVLSLATCVRFCVKFFRKNYFHYLSTSFQLFCKQILYESYPFFV